MNGELYDEDAQRAVEAICEENKELKARGGRNQNE